jgi:hypothetical protein
LAAVEVVWVNAKLAARFRANPRRRENTQELAAINRCDRFSACLSIAASQLGVLEQLLFVE